LLRGENFRLIAQKVQSSQIKLAFCLRQKSSACWIAGWIREYAATFVVALCVLLVALFNISSGQGTSGTIFDTLAGTDNSANPLKHKLTSEASKKNNLATAPLSSANPSMGEADASFSNEDFYSADDYAMMYQPEPTLESQIILASVGPQIPVAKEKRGTRNYEVKMGDTASSIAAAFGVSTSTILSANNLSDTSLLKPGDKLAILPVTGASYKIQKGDSIEAIAKKYNVDVQKVIAYNELPADGKLREGQTLLLPDGYLAPVAPAQNSSMQLAIAGQTPTASLSSSYAPIKLGGGSSGHRFPYGYCTWYVAQRRYVPWGGNASAWLVNAKASGKATGSTPRPGAIVVTRESRWGHVALVEKVNGSSFTISEMNYVGFGKKSTRTLSTGSGVVRGFIY
jgi:surface antigen